MRMCAMLRLLQILAAADFKRFQDGKGVEVGGVCRVVGLDDHATLCHSGHIRTPVQPTSCRNVSGAQLQLWVAVLYCRSREDDQF
jgi:hypothetical protein